MEQEQQHEFYALSEAACNALRNRTMIDRCHTLPVCQFLVLPSFVNSESWDVMKYYSKKEGSTLRLYRTIWRMDLDHEAFKSPVNRVKHPRPYPPTMESDWVPMEEDKLEAVFANIRNIPVPLIQAERCFGCDGAFYELAFGDTFSHSRLGWWSDLSNEWKPLAPAVKELIKLFKSAWKQGGKG